LNIPIGSSSVIDVIFIQDSSSLVGGGLTGLTSGSSGLAGRYLYPGGTPVSLTFETISTQGTYSAPTSNAHLRIKEIDATNAPGWYELQFHNDWFSVANARRNASIVIRGVTNMMQVNYKIDISFDLQPSSAGRTLSVNSSGQAGLDWANVGSPTTTLNLSGTTVKTATDVETDTQDIQARLPAALVSGRMDSSVGAMATDVITSSAIAADAIGSSELAASAVTEIQSGVATSAALATAQADLDDIQTRLPAALVGGRMDSNTQAMANGVITAAAIATDAIDADSLKSDAITEIQSGLSTLTETSIRSAVGLSSANLDTQLDALPTYAELVAALAAADDAVIAILAAQNNLSTSQVRTQVDNALDAWGDEIINLTPTNGSRDAALLAAWGQGFGRWEKDGSTLRIYGANNVTVIRTFTLDDPDQPTSRTPA